MWGRREEGGVRQGEENGLGVVIIYLHNCFLKIPAYSLRIIRTRFLPRPSRLATQQRGRTHLRQCPLMREKWPSSCSWWRI